MERIKTEIPNLPNEIESSKKTVFLEADENQLWQLYIGLDRLNLIPVLQKATKKMAREIHKIGVKCYKWA